MHALFQSQKEAIAEFKFLEKKAEEFLKDLGLAHRIHVREEDDKFPGAEKTLAFDTVLKNGKAMQVLTIHNLGTNFSMPLCGRKVYQICLGFTERILGALKDHYGSELREIDNPYETIFIKKQEIVKNLTVKKLATNNEEFFQNKYTCFEGVRRHVNSGEKIEENWRDHAKKISLQTKRKVMKETELRHNKYFVTQLPVQTSNCLGISRKNNQKFFVKSKV